MFEIVDARKTVQAPRDERGSTLGPLACRGPVDGCLDPPVALRA